MISSPKFPDAIIYNLVSPAERVAAGPVVIRIPYIEDPLLHCNIYCSAQSIFQEISAGFLLPHPLKDLKFRLNFSGPAREKIPGRQPIGKCAGRPGAFGRY